MKLTDLVKKFRAARLMSQSDLARLIDCDRSYIGQLESGHMDISIVFLKKIRRFMTQKEKDEAVKILQDQIKDEFLAK